MKGQRVSLCLLGAVLLLCSLHARGLRRCLISVDTHHIKKSFQEIKRVIQAKDTFQNVTILSASETLRSVTAIAAEGTWKTIYPKLSFSSEETKTLGRKMTDRCCVTKKLLEFYVDRVFKDHEESNPQILRNLSSIANSFLYMQKTLQQCDQKLCHCREEATNITRVIHNIYDQLEVQPAAIKSLGELDVFLAWIDRNHQETSTAGDKEPV